MTGEGQKPDPRVVFVVHGRNEPLRRAMFDFLRNIGLSPLEWTRAIELTQSASPYIGKVLDTAFDQATAVVVLMTPDEVAYLQTAYASGLDDPETRPAPQARPNVLFEAGMAMGRDPRRTVLVEVGEIRPFSDLAGRHAVRLSNDVARRQDLAQRLKTAGCAVDLSGTDWHEAGDFKAPAPPGDGLPLGRRLVSTRGSAETVHFDASYHARSQRSGTLQIINRGSETAYDVVVEIPDEAALSIQAPGPIAKIPGRGKSVSLSVMDLGSGWGSSRSVTAFDLTISARTDSGEEVRQEVFIDTMG